MVYWGVKEFLDAVEESALPQPSTVENSVLTHWSDGTAGTSFGDRWILFLLNRFAFSHSGCPRAPLLLPTSVPLRKDSKQDKSKPLSIAACHCI